MNDHTVNDSRTTHDTQPQGEDLQSQGEDLPRLSRELPGQSPAAPVRIVHVGVGNFHRAHQAWYTHHAPDAAEWGIVGFTGRSAAMAETLNPQDGLFTLVTKGSERDEFEVISSISRVVPAGDHRTFLDYLADPRVVLVTATVTEQGWLADTADDVDILRADPTAPVTTLPARLFAGLRARRLAGGGALTVLSCDNLPSNGQVARRVVLEVAEEIDPTLIDWIEESVDFATSMVDRITPATTDEDRRRVGDELGFDDASPVPTEPFSEWVISGRFPAGRPAWEHAGATIVDDPEPFEQRKLWLLNGSHSLLAYCGSVLGHTTIADAIADERCRTWVEQFWDEASTHLSLPADSVADYRKALLGRFANPRIRHNLAQIAGDGSSKIEVRTLPIVRAERAAGRIPEGAATTLAGWVLHLRGVGAPIKDARAGRFAEAASSTDATAAVREVLALFDPALATDEPLVEAVVRRHAVLSAAAGTATGRD